MRTHIGPSSAVLTITLTLLLFMLTLSSCARPQLNEEGALLVAPPPPPPVVRPDVPRTAPLIDPLLPTQEPQAVLRSFLNATVFVRNAPRGLHAGDPAHPLLFGMKLGELLPRLTRHDLPLLANRMPSSQGRPIRAEQLLRFDFGNETTGELRFSRDERHKITGSELFFERGKPLFEYAYLLFDGAFPVMERETIELLGYTYLIEEASNTTLELHGLDVEQYLLLSNGSALMINGKSYGDTLVTIDPWSIIIRYETPRIDKEGLRLKPGESLRGRLASPEILLHPAFDFAYDGIEQQAEATLTLTAYDDVVRASVFTVLGDQLTLDLVGRKDGLLQWGDEERTLHLSECDFCVAPRERFALLARDGVTLAFEFVGVRPLGESVTLRDQATREEHVIQLVNSTQRRGNHSILEGALRLHGTAFTVRALHNETPERGGSRLAVDLDGDGVIARTNVPFVLLHGHELQFPERNQTNTTRRLELVTPRFAALSEERIPIRIFLGERMERGPILLATENITFIPVDDDRKEWIGHSERGVRVTLRSETRLSEERLEGEELEIVYPPDYRAGLVRILG